MSLLELLQTAHSSEKNFRDENFISISTAYKIVTKDRIGEWSESHPLCTHRRDCPQKSAMINEIWQTNTLVFIVLMFAKLEYLTERLLASNSRDLVLFDSGSFDLLCNSASLSKEHKERLADCRRYVGVKFAHNALQYIPENAILPFYKRESLEKWGSGGMIYRVEIPGQHLRHQKETTFIAEKRIRPSSDASPSEVNRLSREYQTLQKRGKHPNIIPLLASYMLDTIESGHHVQTLHLLFPLAETDLADWMTGSQIPLNITSFSKYERQSYLYRSIYELVSGIAYLHRVIDGTFTTHHDLKPRNILVVNDTLKIGDFGHSHLRPIIAGSATQGIAGLGTYEYQPPEYWDQNGLRTQIKHGRAFDVWSMGCIIIEISILAVYDWQSPMVTEFRNDRKRNANKDRTSPRSIPDDSDASFHNNLAVVKRWVGELKAKDSSQQLKRILDIADRMLAPEPKNRPPIWEVQIDFYETLKSHDNTIVDLEKDLCVGPPLVNDFRRWDKKDRSYDLQPDLKDGTETPLHRAAKSNNIARTIRLWELGWPISLPDSDGETVQDIMKKSNNSELLELETNVTLMLKAAKLGDTEQLRKLFSLGLSPLMVDANGRSAISEAMTSSNIDVVECLLESKAERQLMLWDRATERLPLHTAAKTGFTKAVERVLKYYGDINVSRCDYDTALYYAAEACHTDVVRLLLRHGAKLLPPCRKRIQFTPLHAVARLAERGESIDLMKILLEADDLHKCMNHQNTWGRTPLLSAATDERVEFFKILLEHGASTHVVAHGQNLLHILAYNGRDDLLQLCIKDFSLEELTAPRERSGPKNPKYDDTPLKVAQQNGHKEVVRLLKSHIRQASQSSEGRSKYLTWFKSS